MKVIGIKHFTGDYEGRPYDVYHLYCTPDNVYVGDGNAIYGNCPDCVKVKAEILNKIVSADKIEKLIGKDISVYYGADKKTVAMVSLNQE